MTAATRLALSTPFALLLIQYFDFGMGLHADTTIPAFWKNHGLREVFFAFILCGVSLNFIWSKVNRTKLKVIGFIGFPLIASFWVLNYLVGFGSFADYKTDFIAHVVEAVLFPVGYFMALSTLPVKEK